MIVNFRRCAIVSLVASITGPAVGSVTVTWNYQNWQSQAGNVTALDFNLGSAQILSNQYESLGVTFPDGDDYVAYFEQASGSSDKWFLRDSWGDLQTTFLSIGWRSPRRYRLVRRHGARAGRARGARRRCAPRASSASQRRDAALIAIDALANAANAAANAGGDS
jgi:hypothetical protein